MLMLLYSKIVSSKETQIWFQVWKRHAWMCCWAEKIETLRIEPFGFFGLGDSQSKSSHVSTDNQEPTKTGLLLLHLAAKPILQFSTKL